MNLETSILAYDLQVPTKQLIILRYPIFFSSSWVRSLSHPHILNIRNTIISYVASIRSTTFNVTMKTSRSKNMIPFIDIKVISIIRLFMIIYNMFFFDSLLLNLLVAFTKKVWLVIGLSKLEKPIHIYYLKIFDYSIHSPS